MVVVAVGVAVVVGKVKDKFEDGGAAFPCYAFRNLDTNDYQKDEGENSMNKLSMEYFFKDAVENKIKGLEQRVRNRDHRIEELEKQISELKEEGKRIVISTHKFRLKLESLMENDIWDLPYKETDCEWGDVINSYGIFFL